MHVCVCAIVAGCGREFVGLWACARGFCIHSTYYTVHTTHYTLHTTYYILHTAYHVLSSPYYIRHSANDTLLTTPYIRHTTYLIRHTSCYLLHTTYCKLRPPSAPSAPACFVLLKAQDAAQFSWQPLNAPFCGPQGPF